MKNNFKFILSLLLVVLIAVGTFAGCDDKNVPVSEIPGDDITNTGEDVTNTGEGITNIGEGITNIGEGITNIGEGETVFRFEVTDDEGEVTVWNVHTDKETVGAALLEVELIDGEESSYGLMVTHVNGIRADFTEDNAWWAFLVDGEMSLVGVDSVAIKEGETYAFVYTPN
ncbi:MAG: DUF4430 domain-containing protein [Oscillospiraceae bacterium]|nr:DUF4430 domain-containing protein [Oscillospiraceae bacterium]